MSQKPALDGIRVFEIGSSVAGPYGAWILAQFGAEVIKIEKPGAGDDDRHWGPPFWHGSAAYFQALNRDKRGVTVDFKNPSIVHSNPSTDTAGFAYASSMPLITAVV